MSTEKVINRWFVAVGNSVIQLVFGAIYALFIFTKVLSDPFTKGLSDPVGSNQFTVTALRFGPRPLEEWRNLLPNIIVDCIHPCAEVFKVVYHCFVLRVFWVVLVDTPILPRRTSFYSFGTSIRP